MFFGSAWRKAKWSLAQRGFGGTLRFAVAALRRPLAKGEAVSPSRHPFDEDHGTDTGGVIGGGDLAVGGAHDAFITGYAGVPPSRLLAVLDRWQALPEAPRPADYAFVDLGCGKGRALLLASNLPFREIVGVELHPGLVETARRNISFWRREHPSAPPIHVHCEDATNLQLPCGGCLVFIYNAFGAPVLRKLLESFASQLVRGDRPLFLAFQNEDPAGPLRSDRRLELLWSGTLPLTPEQAASEPVSSPEDITTLYRWATP